MGDSPLWSTSPSPALPWRRFLMGVGCRVVRMASLERSVRRVPMYFADLFRATWRLRRMLRSDGVDLVHINTCVTPYPGIAARSLGLPVVWHVRECLRPNAINNVYLKGIVRLAHRVVAVSGAVRAHVERLAPGAVGKLAVINNGIDLDRFEREMSAGKTRAETSASLKTGFDHGAGLSPPPQGARSPTGGRFYPRP